MAVLPGEVITRRRRTESRLLGEIAAQEGLRRQTLKAQYVPVWMLRSCLWTYLPRRLASIHQLRALARVSCAPRITNQTGRTTPPPSQGF